MLGRCRNEHVTQKSGSDCTTAVEAESLESIFRYESWVPVSGGGVGILLNRPRFVGDWEERYPVVRWCSSLVWRNSFMSVLGILQYPPHCLYRKCSSGSNLTKVLVKLTNLFILDRHLPVLLMT
jgi:hypothetical protein